MEALIPKLFILTAEASIVLFLILIVIIIFNAKAKRKDLNAVNELISNYTGSKEERISALKKHLKMIGFKGDNDEQAEKLFTNEKSIIKEFVTLYLRHDTYRLLDYSDNITDNNDIFLKTSGSGQAVTVTQAPEEAVTEMDKSEETATATILAREQAESNEAHLKELSELRLKNTELNEHLFEALETITALMTEHGKKTGQEVGSNAQKLLEAIIYLRDTRLEQDTDPSQLAPNANDEHDKVESFDLSSSDLATNDSTLDDSTAVNLGINDELNMDLDALDEDVSNNAPTPSHDESNAINLEDTEVSTATQDTPEPETPEDDPWADALTEQANAEAEVEATPEDSNETEGDPWADALAEQATAEAVSTPEAEAEPKEEEADPWADALAEQASAEASSDTDEDEVDPWADALAEQASSEADSAAQAEETDPWAEALAEQEKSEKK